MSSDSPAPVRLGLIGAGRWGRNYITTIQSLSSAWLAALCSHNPASKDLIDPQCWLTSDWRALLAREDIDGVIIATPPETHAEMLEAVLRAKIPTMIEKPLVLSLSETLRLQTLQREMGTPVLVDHTQLFNTAFIEFKRQAERLGPVGSIQCEDGNWGPFRSYSALWDYGPHSVSLCLDLLRGLPVSVTIQQLESHMIDGGFGGSYRIAIGFAHGMQASIRVSNLMQTKTRRFTAVFDTHELIFDDLAVDKLVRLERSTGAIRVIAIEPTSPLSLAVQSFVLGIQGNPSEHFGLDMAVNVARVLDLPAGV